MDLLSLLFESDHCTAKEDAVLHIEAAHPRNQMTKAQLRSLVGRIAYSLRSSYNVGTYESREDVITVITHGQLLIAALFYGILSARGVFSAVSPTSSCEELTRQVKLAKSRLIVCGQEQLELACKAAKECDVPLRNVLLLDSTHGSWRLGSLDRQVDLMDDDVQQHKWTTVLNPVILRQRLAMILWSSGTTGLPKGVMLSHTNLVGQAYLPALHDTTTSGTQSTEYMTLAHLPISHIAGAFSYLVRAMFFGGTVYWMRQYEWHEMLDGLERYRISHLFTVPSIWLRISKDPHVHRKLRHLRATTSGAATMGESLQRAANRQLASGTDTFIGQTWGLSETTGAVTWPLSEAPDDTGSAGFILPGVELRLVDEHYRDVQPGQKGELLVRSLLVTNGYYGNADATKASFHGEWFCSGDVAQFREDKLYIVDRKKEIFKYKGSQIAPAELENLLFTHPKIREAAIVGVPAQDSSGSEVPRAYVVANVPGTLSAAEVEDYVNSQVAAYKQLRGGVALVDNIPKNAAGKFLRRLLRGRAAQERLPLAKL